MLPLSVIPIQSKDLKYIEDYLVVVLHVVVGYIDLFYDIEVMILLSHDGSKARSALALNITVFVVHVLLGLVHCVSYFDFAITLLLLKPLMEGFVTIRDGKETADFGLMKKLEVVVRGIPAIVIQLRQLFFIIASATDPGQRYQVRQWVNG